MFWRARMACSFCGKGPDDVGKLVAGYPRKVYICDGCVDVVRAIMDEDAGKPVAPLRRRGRRFRLWDRLRLRREALMR